MLNFRLSLLKFGSISRGVVTLFLEEKENPTYLVHIVKNKKTKHHYICLVPLNGPAARHPTAQNSLELKSDIRWLVRPAGVQAGDWGK